MLEQVAAQKVAVFVALEVRGAVGDGLAVEGHGKEGKVLRQGLDIMLLAGPETARLDDGADLVRQIADIVHFLLESGAQAHFLTQTADVLQQFDHRGQILDALDVRLHAGLDFGGALGRFGIRGREQGQLVIVAHDDAHMIR